MATPFHRHGCHRGRFSLATRLHRHGCRRGRFSLAACPQSHGSSLEKHEDPAVLKTCSRLFPNIQEKRETRPDRPQTVALFLWKIICCMYKNYAGSSIVFKRGTVTLRTGCQGEPSPVTTVPMKRGCQGEPSPVTTAPMKRGCQREPSPLTTCFFISLAFLAAAWQNNHVTRQWRFRTLPFGEQLTRSL